MNNKLLSLVAIIVLLAGLFTVFITVANAENLNLLHSKKQYILVTLKNEADINKSKERILKIPKIKVINIKDRDKEWSKMVNKYDLPNMENPFKNELTIKTNKNADINEVYNQIKEMNFIEKVELTSDTKFFGK